MLRTLLFVSTIAAALASITEIHHDMSPDEVRKTFGTTHENVPIHRVIFPFHAFHKKNKDHSIVQLMSFERKMTLYLEPTNGYLAGIRTPVFRAFTNTTIRSKKVKFERIPNAIKPEHKFYQDPFNMAALLIKHTKQGKALIHGIIEGTLAIRPLPERFRSQFKRDKRCSEDDATSNARQRHHENYHELEETHPHVIYELAEPEIIDDEVPLEPLGMGRTRSLLHAKVNSTMRLPATIHPQLMVIMEYHLYDTFRDVNDAVEYMLGFWNAVDLRYRAFMNPDVRLNIAGLILAEDMQVTSYLQSNRVNVTGYTDKVLARDAAFNKSAFLYNETIYDPRDGSLYMHRLGFKYDTAITMTPYDMCSFNTGCIVKGEYVCHMSSAMLKKNCNTLGYAFYTGACYYDPEDQLMQSVAIIEDRGAFDGIIPAAHEVGHLLGASHSPENVNKCPTDDGYLMSGKLYVSEKSFVWSNCSVYSVKKFLMNNERSRCMFNKPFTGRQLRRLLPGQIFSRAEQCERLLETGPCQNPEESSKCDRLYCQRPHSSSCVAVPNVAVPEGTKCGKGYHCINAKCVEESARTVRLEVGTTTTESPPVLEENDVDFGLAG